MSMKRKENRWQLLKRQRLNAEKLANLTFCIESDDDSKETPSKKPKCEAKKQPKNKSIKAENSASITFCIESECEDEDEIITGNDSFSYNEEMKFGGHYCHPNVLRFGYDDDAAEDVTVQKFRPDMNKFWLNSPIEELPNELKSMHQDTDISFDLQADGALTSTLINDLKPPEGNENSFLCNISKMEQILASSSKNMQDELNDLKKKVTQPSVAKENTVAIPKEKALKEGSKGVVLDVQVLSKPSSSDDPCKDLEVAEVAGEVEVLSCDNPNFQLPTCEDSEVPDDAFQGRVSASTELFDDQALNNTGVVELPVQSKIHYQFVEALLLLRNDGEVGDQPSHQQILREMLTEALSPEEGETVAKYMDRTICIVFDIDFFVDCLSWRPEKDEHRLYFESSSNILKCWKDAYEKAFGNDVNETEFKKHFRRFKMAKRAGRKGEKKQMEKQPLVLLRLHPSLKK